jgi:hypothetical protein
VVPKYNLGYKAPVVFLKDPWGTQVKEAGKGEDLWGNQTGLSHGWDKWQSLKI